MRKLFALLLALTTFCTMAYAETAFDPAQYTEEELREIDTLIHMHLTKTEEGTVLYDENGIYVEYRGIYNIGYGIGANLFIQNNSGKDLKLLSLYAIVNMANISLTNSGWITLQNGTMLMTKIDHHFYLEYGKLKEWEFSSIQSLEFTILVEENDSRTDHCIIPISLTLDYPLVSS